MFRGGNGCGSFGRAVASDTIGSSVCMQTLAKVILNICLMSTVLKDESK